MKNLLVPIALAGLLIAGCGNGRYSASEDAAIGQPAAAPTKSAATHSNPGPTLASSTTMNRVIIRSATLSLRVDKVDAAEKRANSIVADAGGYVDSVSSTDLATSDPKIDIRARIPVAKFDQVLQRLESLGVRLSKTIQGQDVTEKVVDFDARLKTMSAQEEVYRNMLRRVSSLEASTQLQDKLMNLRAEIESIQGQRKSLASAAALSTIELTLQQQATPAAMAQTDPSWGSSAWQSAQSSAASTFKSLAVVLMWLAAYAPIWVPIAALGWFVHRRSKRRVVAA